MNIFKTDSEIEKKVQRVEALLNELGLSIESGTIRHGPGLVIRDTKTDNTYPFVDTESRDCVSQFPRWCEGVRIRADVQD